MEIEFAGTNDECEVRQLLAGCDLPVEDFTASLLQHFFVVRNQSHIVGLVGLELFGRWALLRSLAVQEKIRRQGIASRLIERAEAYAHSHDVESLYLLTTTAKDFFEKHGYRTTDRSQAPPPLQETAEFKSICPSTAACMVKYFSRSETRNL